MDTPVSGVDAWLKLNGQPLRFAPDQENEAAGAQELQRNNFTRQSGAPADLAIIVEDEAESLPAERYGLWYWLASDYAGLYRIHVDAPGQARQTALVRVRPTKVSYARYKIMLEEIASFGINLLYRLGSPAHERVRAGKGARMTSSYEEYTKLDSIFTDVASALTQIRLMPHQVLAKFDDTANLADPEVRTGKARPLSGPMQRLSPVVARKLGLTALPLEYIRQQEFLTYDVYENQLLKHFLVSQLRDRLIGVLVSIEGERQRLVSELKMQRANGWERDIAETEHQLSLLSTAREAMEKMARQSQTLGAEPFLRSVRALSLPVRPTQVLQKHRAYHRFFAALLRFRRDLDVNVDTQDFVALVALRKMAEIYEIWAVFYAAQLIMQQLETAGFVLISQDGFFRMNTNRFIFDVQRDAATVEYGRDNLRVRLRYEPRYVGNIGNQSGLMAYRKSLQTPDFAAEVWDVARRRPLSVIVLDAKYKIFSVDGENRYKDEDLNKMREYQDHIRYRTWDPRRPDLRPEKIVSSAYILYPGDVVDHDPDDPRFGAIPLAPDMPKAFVDQADQIVEDLLEAVHLLD